jgi:GNAT superfamily N-acetyltransferase
VSDRGVELRHVRFGDPEVATVLTGLAQEYERRYGANDEMSSVDPRQWDPPDGVFLVLVRDGVTVAGGALRRLSPDTCEAKRMWTAPEHRRQGYASLILDALEDAGRSRGYAHLRLETGPEQPEARAMYLERGYTPIPPYGIYPRASAFEHHLHERGQEP